MRHRVGGLLLVAAMLSPVVLTAASAGATGWGGGCNTSGGTTTYSPPIPTSGSSVPSVSGTMDFTDCVSFGNITSGTAVYSGKAQGPADCSFLSGPDTLPTFVGTLTITWNTGQTTTIAGMVTNDGNLPPGTPQAGGEGESPVTGGLFAGASVIEETGAVGNSFNAGACTSAPLTTQTFGPRDSAIEIFDNSGTLCAGPQSCKSSFRHQATAVAPGLTVSVVGTPSKGVGTVQLTTGAGAPPCAGAPTAVTPFGTLTDTGFTATDRLTVTATLPITASSSAQQVCFNSTVPFKSQSSPTTPKAGSAFLLTCAQASSVPPCVLSSAQVGANTVVTFVVPGGDPRFSIVIPKGKGTVAWASSLPPAKKGHPYSAHLQTSGGKSPVQFKLASGGLPTGCKIDQHTGTIAGTPTKTGKFTAVVQATDSESTPKSVKLTLPITVS